MNNPETKIENTPAPALNKEWGRAINGGFTIVGAGCLASLALGRVVEAAKADTLPAKEQLILAAFLIVAAACVAITRGVVSIGIGAGKGRTPVLLFGLGSSVIILIVFAVLYKPAAPTVPFWIALSLPVIGSLIEDRLASK